MARCSVPWASILLEAAKEGREGEGRTRDDGKGGRIRNEAEGQKDAGKTDNKVRGSHTFFSYLSVTRDTQGGGRTRG